MSSTTLIVVCIVAAAVLVAILAMVMLAPTRLRRPFAQGHTGRQWAALREKRRARAAQRHRRPAVEEPALEEDSHARE